MKELKQIVFEATYGCASNCIFCYNCWKAGYKKEPELDIKQLRTILKKLPKFKRFVISGGEPLLRPDLKDIIKEGKKYTNMVSVLTSGILLNDDWARMLKKHDVFVQVPLHGMEKTHNAHTRVKDSYRKAIIGIAYLKKHGVRFAVSTVATKKNIKDFKDTLELGVALGAQELLVIRFMPGGEGLKNSELMLDYGEYKYMLETFDAICRKYRVFGAIGAPNVPCVFPDKGYKFISKSSCGAGIDWIAIDPSGRVRICNHSPTILGSLLTQDFKEIWNHQLLKDFRAKKVVPKECEGCEHRDDCRGGCRAVAETYFGSLTAPEPLMLLKPAK